MNNNDYSLFNNILLPVSGLSWYFEGLVVFLTLYSTLLPLSHSNDTSVSVSQLLTCLHSLFTGVSLTALQTWVLSSSFFDLLLFYFFEIVNSVSLPWIQAATWQKVLQYTTQELGVSKRLMCLVFHFCWAGSVVSEGCSLFSCQSWRNTKSKLSHQKQSPKISWCVISLH